MDANSNKGSDRSIKSLPQFQGLYISQMALVVYFMDLNFTNSCCTRYLSISISRIEDKPATHSPEAHFPETLSSDRPHPQASQGTT